MNEQEFAITEDVLKEIVAHAIQGDVTIENTGNTLYICTSDGTEFELPNC